MIYKKTKNFTFNNFQNAFIFENHTHKHSSNSMLFIYVYNNNNQALSIFSEISELIEDSFNKTHVNVMVLMFKQGDNRQLETNPFLKCFTEPTVLILSSVCLHSPYPGRKLYFNNKTQHKNLHVFFYSHCHIIC